MRVIPHGVLVRHRLKSAEATTIDELDSIWSRGGGFDPA
jgi:hypothetical protein